MTGEQAPRDVVDRPKGIALMLAAAVLWSGNGVGVKVLPLSAMSIAGWRSLFAMLVMLVMLVAIAVRKDPDRPLASQLARPLVWCSAASYALMVVSFVVATKLTTAANAVLIQYTAPVYIALLSWPILNERIRAIDWISILAMILGMGLFFRDKLSSSGLLGNFIAILSSLGFAALPVFLRLDQRTRGSQGRATRDTPLLAMTLGNAIACVVCTPKMLEGPPGNWTVWMELGGIGAFQIALPYFIYGIAVRALSALETSLVAMVEPVLSPIWVFVVTGERPTRSAICGGAVILAAVALRSLAKLRQRGESEERLSPMSRFSDEPR